MNIELKNVPLGTLTNSAGGVTYTRSAVFELFKEAVERFISGDDDTDIFTLATVIQTAITTGRATVVPSSTQSVVYYNPITCYASNDVAYNIPIQVIGPVVTSGQGLTITNGDKLVEDIAFISKISDTKKCDMHGHVQEDPTQNIISITTLTPYFDYTIRFLMNSPSYGSGPSWGFIESNGATYNYVGTGSETVRGVENPHLIIVDLNGEWTADVIRQVDIIIEEAKDDIVARVSKQFVQR